MKTIRKIILLIALVFLGSTNLWAARYIFYFKDSSGQFHFMSATSGNYPGTVKSSDNPSDQSDYIWYCKSRESTDSKYDATISTSSKYFYATYSSKNYWLCQAQDNASQIELDTDGGNSYSIDSNGYLREGTSSYYVYYQASDGTWRTSNTSSNYNNKRPSYIEYTGSNINSATVKSYPEAGGYVFVTSDIDREFSDTLTSDNASRKYPAVYYLYAKPKSGYEFLGWSKTQGGTIESTSTSYMISVVNTNETYYANYKALTYTVSFVKNSSTATGSMDPVTPTIGVDYTLPELGFVDNITVTFDANGGTFPAKGTNNYSETQSKFNNWSGSDGNSYANKGTINKSTGDAITLTAQWNSSRAFTVPSATRGDRELRGYNHDGGETTWLKSGATPGSQVWPSSSYTLYAVWGDPFYAQVNLSKTAGTAGTPTVDVAKKSSDTKSTDITFTITAPEPSSGYYFNGWTYSGTGVTITNSSSSNTTVKVKSASTAGSTNTVTVTANYESYSRNIIITASGTPEESGDKVIFNVTGPQTYRVSVPVGGTVTLKDVTEGSYTITPQGWSWNYTVDKTKETTSWNAQNKSTHTFKFTYKGSSKKHTESIVTYKP